MLRPLQLVFSFTALMALAACSTDKPAAPPTPKASRVAEAIFTASSIVTVKNAIMGACSTKQLHIQPAGDQVICVRYKTDVLREQIVASAVNSEFAKHPKDLVRFTLTSSGKDVLVLGSALVQFQAPLSVMPDGGYRTDETNLLDANSFAMVQEILTLAGAKQ
jgi:hypothetical protein